MLIRLRVLLYYSKNESDIASRWVHRESNLMFTLSNNKGQRKNRFAFAFVQCNLKVQSKRAGHWT